MYEIKSRYSEGLHVLRGLAAVSVVFFHAAHMSPVADVGVLTIVHEFGAGVTLFFILSGFSLTLSNAGKTDEPGWIRSYAIKRFFRIAPVWYLMIGASAVYHYFEYGKIYKVEEIARHLLPLFPFAPSLHESLVWAGWTIGVEVIFYTVFPLLLAVFGIRILPWAILTVCALVVSAGFPPALPEGTWASFGYMAFPRQFPVFCVGALLCVLALRTPQKYVRSLRVAAGLASMILFAWWAAKHLHPASVPLFDAVMFKAFAMGSLTLFMFAPRTVLHNPVTKFWGDASYGIYLIHPIIAYETKPIMIAIASAISSKELAFLVYALVVLGITCVLAGIVHRFIENPLFRYGHMVANRNRKAAAATRAQVASEEPLLTPRSATLAKNSGSFLPSLSVAGIATLLSSALSMAKFKRAGDGTTKVNEDWLQLILLLALAGSFGKCLLVLFTSLNDPILDWHGFRQTQTAISVWSMLHGGPLLGYETPVLGAPWTIPFEAPIYQWSVALVASLTPFGLDAAGRLTSFLYLLGAILVGVKILRLLLPEDRHVSLLFTVLVLASPQYMFWGRTFLIETCAVFWCLLFLYAAMRFYRRPAPGWFALAFTASLLGVLTKSTTWPAYAAAFALFWAADAVRERRIRLVASAGVAAIGLVSIGATLLWNGYADALKAQSVYGRYVTSASLSAWNFGTLEQRLEPALWLKYLPKQMLPASLGSLWPLLIVAATHVARPSANAMIAAAGAVLFMFPILLFANLHMVHAYYQTANSIFLLAATAALLGGLMNALRWRVALLFFLIVLVGQAEFSRRQRLSFVQQDLAAAPAYQAARAAREMIPEGRGLYAFGVDWSSEVHYYAERKGIAFASWFRSDDLKAALDDPAAFLGEAPFGGAVDCRAVGAKFNDGDMAMIDGFLARLEAEGAARRDIAGCSVYAAAP